MDRKQRIETCNAGPGTWVLDADLGNENLDLEPEMQDRQNRSNDLELMIEDSGPGNLT